MRKYLHQAWLGKNGIQSYIIVTILTVVGYMLGQVPMLFAIMRVMQSGSIDGKNMSKLQEFSESPDFAIWGISRNVGFLLILLTFVAGLVVFYFAFRFFHRRTFTSLISTVKSINFRKIAFGFGFWLLLGLLLEGTMYLLHPETYTMTFNGSSFIILLVLSLIILPMQTSFEELLFRGYMMQGIGSIASTPIIPLLITSIAFASIHLMNPEVGQYGLIQMMTYYLFAGLFLGIITIMDDSLELALGVHFATNFFGSVILGYEGAAIQTDSLFKTNAMDVSTMTLGFVVTASIFVFVANKVYGWKDWGYLFTNIKKQRPQQKQSGSLDLDYENIIIDEQA